MNNMANNFNVNKYLKDVEIEDNLIRLPVGQLDRKEYLEVKNKLELIGGKWKGGKTQAFIFEQNPKELLDKICDGENINLKKEFQFFETPEKIADNLVYYADIQNYDTVLEPSAGRGAILKAIAKISPVVPCCYEIMDLNKTMLIKTGLNYRLLGEDFLNNDDNLEYSKIVANPPFSKNQDIKHIYEMWNRLARGGRIVTIASAHWKNCDNKKEKEFREWLENKDAEIIGLENGEFKESGTMIKMCIIILNKPLNDVSRELDEVKD